MHMEKKIEFVLKEEFILDELNHFQYSAFSKENKVNNN